LCESLYCVNCTLLMKRDVDDSLINSVADIIIKYHSKVGLLVNFELYGSIELFRNIQDRDNGIN
ncbi:hypothetical protein BgiBS90_020675, partial [Biomphalaria glabrata]